MCVIIYKPCILFTLCICLLNLLQCWDIHSRADIQMIFLCLKPVCNVCPLSGTSLLIVSGLRSMHILQYYILSVHQGTTCTHPAFPPLDHVCMKTSSADTQGAGLSDLRPLARTQNWIPSGEYLATSSDHSNLHFLGLCWRLLKSGTFCCIGDNLQHCIFSFFFFTFAWFSLVFCYIFWDLKVLLNPCTAGVGSCRDEGTVHFFLGQQWLTGCIGTLIY